MGVKLSSLALLTASALVATASQAATPYTFVDLGMQTSQSFARAINDTGKIAGYALFPDESAYHATAWEGTNVTNLGTLGGSFSSALGINSSGQIVGYSEIAEGRTQHAARWNDTDATDLPSLGGQSSQARAINNAGQVAGDSYLSDENTRRATLWDGQQGDGSRHSWRKS